MSNQFLRASAIALMLFTLPLSISTAQADSEGDKNSVGDTGPNGGKVYYIDGSGEHGLEVQAVDEGTTLDWSSAATAASAHGAGWHLPTKTELELLYKQQSVVGGFNDNLYWSSTESEHDSQLAWSLYFLNGNQKVAYKDFMLKVRAVRAF